MKPKKNTRGIKAGKGDIKSSLFEDDYISGNPKKTYSKNYCQQLKNLVRWMFKVNKQVLITFMYAHYHLEDIMKEQNSQEQ